jgi:hypothetical protein
MMFHKLRITYTDITLRAFHMPGSPCRAGLGYKFLVRDVNRMGQFVAYMLEIL